ncbi:hypothetical protein B0I37DRAFT_340790 [Chaetomium sp. MPI-CAGE-AT-0009]|nr:hypothetical protein B0I37DRAFT_340790 [Chaetomium sp. MPI-CAGE-AT-0009]
MARRNLLVCFDAFGTLFHPKSPVAEQYATVARQCGLDGFTTEDVQASFKKAFSSESKAHPNYGKASGMGAPRWWTNVITKTFQPLVGTGVELPKDLGPKLLHRFASHEGYTLSPGVAPLLRSLKQPVPAPSHPQIPPILGVITNSDDRVPSILSSLGLHIRPLRFGTTNTNTNLDANANPLQPHQQQHPHASAYDIDLHCMSYDVGFAKPDRRIFDAAEAMADQLAAASITSSQGGGGGVPRPWLKVYVGDEYAKDVVGARGAGWNAILIVDHHGGGGGGGGGEGEGLQWLGDGPLEEVFPSGGRRGRCGLGVSRRCSSGWGRR